MKERTAISQIFVTKLMSVAAPRILLTTTNLLLTTGFFKAFLVRNQAESIIGKCTYRWSNGQVCFKEGNGSFVGYVGEKRLKGDFGFLCL